MEASELRQFSVDELNTKLKQWRDELFRSRFKAQSSETKNTSVFPKLRRDIARALTVLGEKVTAGETPTAKPTIEHTDKPVIKASVSAEQIEPKTAKKQAEKSLKKKAPKKEKSKE